MVDVHPTISCWGDPGSTKIRVPSTYHQCLKVFWKGRKIHIYASDFPLQWNEAHSSEAVYLDELVNDGEATPRGSKPCARRHGNIPRRKNLGSILPHLHPVLPLNCESSKRSISPGNDPTGKAMESPLTWWVSSLRLVTIRWVRPFSEVWAPWPRMFYRTRG